jgi:hypothetical protein
MGTHTTTSNEKPYHYYKCFRRSDYKRGICEQKSLRAEHVEASVWGFISSLLKDPERIRAGMGRLIAQEADRDALLEPISGQMPESLDSLDGEERNTVYRMLRLAVTPTPEGRYELTGAFCTAEPLSA